MDLAYKRRPSRLNVLLVEDDELDALNVRRVLEATTDVAAAADGMAALDLLRSGQVPRERLVVLLDLRLPRMGGLEFLRAVREDPDLCAIPIVVFSTSEGEEDLAEAYRLGAAGFLAKPRDPDELKRRLRAFAEYWSHQELPA